MRAIGADVVERRAGQHTAIVPGVAVALAVIIAVEQIVIGRIEDTITENMIAQDKRLKEPCRVCQMPFCWRCIGHRLHRGVCIGERLGKRQRPRTGGRKAMRKGVGGDFLRCHDCPYQFRNSGNSKSRARFRYRDAPGTQRTSSAPFPLATRAIVKR